jgi:hypothetical protein
MTIESITGELPDEALRGLELREWREEEVGTYVGLLDTHHYLDSPHVRRRHLCQVACHEGKAVALIIWTTASAKLAGRESYVGWDSRTRQKRLGWLVQNNRFLLLPSKRPSNLASRVLGLAVQALPDACLCSATLWIACATRAACCQAKTPRHVPRRDAGQSQASRESLVGSAHGQRPAQVNFPCIRSVAEIKRESVDKRSGQSSKGRRIYLSSREKELPAAVLGQIRLRWNVENKNHPPGFARTRLRATKSKKT